jgi:MATE family multidrug resistance protein
MPYLPWAAAIPICGVAAFMWDGIYIGATATREMFFSLLLGTICFFVMRYALGHLLEDANDALWCSFLLYLLMRGAYLGLRWKSIIRNALRVGQ